MKDVFLQILKISLEASLVALAVIALRLVFRKAPRQLICALWILVGIRLLIPALPASRVSVVPETVSSGSVIEQAAAIIPEETERLEASDREFQMLVENREVIPKRDETGQSYILVSKETRKEARPLGETLVPVLAYCWAAGTLLMLGYLLFGWFRVWKKTRISVREEGNVWLCDEPGTPFVFGLIRPRIFIPSGLSEETKACVLAHERAHIARRDLLRKTLAFLLLCVHWFNPLMWLSFILLCRDIEKACDEQVIRGKELSFRKAYSEALLSLSVRGGWISACPVAFGETGVKGRVKSALQYRKPAFWVVLLLVVLAAAAAACTLTDPVTTEETSDGLVHFKTSRYNVAAREGDVEGDGWIFTFMVEDYTDISERESVLAREENAIWYVYNVLNVRHWDAVYGGDEEALQRDYERVYQILKDNTLPEDLLTTDPDSVSFEVLDKDQFFRLMRKALTATPQRPEKQKSFDYLYDQNYYSEKDYKDGYAFRFCVLECWGFMDVTFFDIAFGTKEDYVLLSDLVDEGTATPEQQEAYKLLREVSKKLDGEEWNFALGSETYKDTVIGTIDFGRLAKMVNDLDSNFWDWFSVYDYNHQKEIGKEPESEAFMEQPPK